MTHWRRTVPVFKLILFLSLWTIAVTILFYLVRIESKSNGIFWNVFLILCWLFFLQIFCKAWITELKTDLPDIPIPYIGRVIGTWRLHIVGGREESGSQVNKFEQVDVWSQRDHPTFCPCTDWQTDAIANNIVYLGGKYHKYIMHIKSTNHM